MYHHHHWCHSRYHRNRRHYHRLHGHRRCHRCYHHHHLITIIIIIIIILIIIIITSPILITIVMIAVMLVPLHRTLRLQTARTYRVLPGSRRYGPATCSDVVPTKPATGYRLLSLVLRHKYLSTHCRPSHSSGHRSTACMALTHQLPTRTPV